MPPPMPAPIPIREDLHTHVTQALGETPVWDLHTHLYPPSFGSPLAGSGSSADPSGLMLWGIDELLTYHYLVAEIFRATSRDELSYERYWSLSQAEQADLIWVRLFRQQSPLSEACRGVLTTLSRLGLDPDEPTLAGYRKWFAEQDPSDHIDRVMQLAGVERITMTNDVFDDNERQRWLDNPQIGADSRFRGVLRFDPLLCDWPTSASRLREWGYAVDEGGFSRQTIEESQRFLREWFQRVGAVYGAVSLPPTFRYPAPSSDRTAVAGEQALVRIVLPVCEELGLPFAMMIGVTRSVNPAIRLAGDTVGLADVTSVANLCRDFPQQKFLCTMLARENQHELAVTGRKFANLLPFGCWWFLNNPSLIEEMTRMRLELLGTSFVPQHSDCRVLEQLIYKWDHSREVIARVLTDKYADLAATGYAVTDDAIKRDVHQLLWGTTEQWLAGKH
ncbi:MAG: glucuronate isomerase [Planctomycetota bacterium]